ncbi:MAG: acyl-CoA dehydrogenase family protein [Deltaproteobacteria bacterium]|nr:acyl-CoA dehydrogenase family protein [Deltaproteobacteria bacterium]
MSKLKDFSNRVNESLYSDDKTLHMIMSCHVTGDKKKQIETALLAMEKNMPYWNALANEAAQKNNLPRLESYDCLGNKQERIHIPLETRLLRHRVVESGIFDSNSEFEKFTKVYLLSQIGESSVCCPLAYTDSVLCLLRAKGSEYLKNKYLDQLKSSELPLSASHFIIEPSSGSDYGAIDGVAKTKNHEEYQIFAEKWFCSSPEELFLVAARIEGADPGTKGLSLFLVPHMIPSATKGQDYVTNSFTIKRLKNKLGNQSLPTAEINLEGSKGYLVGYPSEGYANLIDYVINCTRIHWTAHAIGFYRRAFIEARNYAQQRIVFKKNIIKFPLIAERMIDILSQLASQQNMFCYLLDHIDEYGWMPRDEGVYMWRRFLINILKYRSTLKLTDSIKTAMLVFGANSICKDFSILSRLLGDSLALETIQETHDALCMQIMREMHKFDLIGRLNQEIEGLISSWPDDILVSSKKVFIHNFDVGNKVFTTKNLYDPHWAQTHALRFVNHFSVLMEIGHLVKTGSKLNCANILILASHLTHKYLSDRFSGFVSPTIEHLTDFCQDLIREEPIDIDMK